MGIRAFLAFDIPASVAQYLQKIVVQLQRQYPRSAVGWVHPGQMHCTLHFLGNDVAENAISVIRTEGRRLCTELAPLELETGSIGTFPAQGEPKIIYLGCTGSGARQLGDLRQRFGAIIAGLNIPVDQRPWHPHLTLGRIRTDHAPRPQPAPSTPQSFTITEAILYRSTLTPTGPIYARLESFPFSRSQ
ncbi:MAG: RNA 2',3'-cyclic phosphodiesterase [Patescibacteria group bacterium]|nr:RNA 2',3'-cyclic phosphodiesterase [Patescibacteria group bacterium]